MAVDPAHLQYLPESTRSNYSAVAREVADRDNITPKQAMADLAKGFLAQHKADPAAGYDHLYAWAKQHDPADQADVSPAQQALLNAVESARRDPAPVIAQHEAVLTAAKEALGVETPSVSTAEPKVTSGS